MKTVSTRISCNNVRNHFSGELHLGIFVADSLFMVAKHQQISRHRGICYMEWYIEFIDLGVQLGKQNTHFIWWSLTETMSRVIAAIHRCV